MSSVGTCSLAVDPVCSSLDTLVYDYPFFPRGNGPLISILIPTRGRPDHLSSAVKYLCDLAYNKSDLEFIFKVDDDDIPTIDAINEMVRDIHPKVIMSPRGRGYLDMHIWVNQMCSIASGDWLFLMNDDVRMITESWDNLVDRFTLEDKGWPGARDICLLVLSNVNNPDAREFVMLRRKTYELLGHFSLAPYCDDWIWRVMWMCGCTLKVPIYVEHFCVKDDVWDEHSGDLLATLPVPSIEVIQSRIADMTKIVDRMSWFKASEKE